jgi:hypothetical protein
VPAGGGAEVHRTVEPHGDERSHVQSAIGPHVTQNNSAVSISRRVLFRSVATARWSLNRTSRVDAGFRIRLRILAFKSPSYPFGRLDL